MYRLMLVDDEYAVRKQVVDKIDWSQYDIEIVCEAENGNEAIELFEQFLPDIVITDIKMPFLNGLELSEKILEKYPYTKIIVLTGFDEFEYAKKSVDLHIMNYVLKPISAKSLIAILEEVKNKLDQEIENKRSMERLRDYYEKSYALLRDKFLEDFVKGAYDDDEIEEWLEYYQIKLLGNSFLVSIVQIDNYFSQRKEIDSKESEFKKLALLQFIEEINEKEQLGISFLCNNQVVIISHGYFPNENEFLNIITKKLDMIRQGIERYQKFTITIAIGHIGNCVLEIPSSMKSASNAYDYKLAMGNNQIIYINDLEPNKTYTVEFNDLLKKRLIRILKSGVKSEFQEYLDETFNLLALNNKKSSDNQLYLFELLTQIIITAKEFGVDITKADGKELNLFQLVGENQQLDYLKSKISLLGNFLIDESANSRVALTKNLVTLVKNYIHNEFKNCELSVQELSDLLCYSPNYISAVFKKETGQAIMNYLTDFRLEVAKKFLITTEMKSIDIAMEVGFASSNYFAYCFKKQFDISPTQYRKDFTTIM